jgi:hypothetical protein
MAQQSQAIDQPQEIELPAFLSGTTIAPLLEPVLPIPDFLIAELPKGRSVAVKQLELQVYESLFETTLDKVTEGMNIKTILDLDGRGIEKGRFIRWIMKDEQRRTRYYAAQQAGAEIIFEEMIDIADAENSFEDVQRSKLRIDTRKWVLGIHDKKRFGDKSNELVVNVNLGEAMARAAERVANRPTRVITQDGEVVE